MKISRTPPLLYRRQSAPPTTASPSAAPSRVSAFPPHLHPQPLTPTLPACRWHPCRCVRPSLPTTNPESLHRPMTTHGASPRRNRCGAMIAHHVAGIRVCTQAEESPAGYRAAHGVRLPVPFLHRATTPGLRASPARHGIAHSCYAACASRLRYHHSFAGQQPPHDRVGTRVVRVHPRPAARDDLRLCTCVPPVCASPTPPDARSRFIHVERRITGINHRSDSAEL
mmetsp:Transcript_12956/g.34569  ORF Transcript_12956/g.34569 Transcript_12956/m.34569 type:complete len:226 (-) Transcript_12956:19-696(-)